MGSAATNLTNKLLMLGSKLGIVGWKNPRGLAFHKDGSPVKYGVGPNGASDVIGYRKLIVTPEMVGRKIAQFFCVEVKTERDSVRQDQIDFINQVIADGGDGLIARSEEDLKNHLTKPSN